MTRNFLSVSQVCELLNVSKPDTVLKAIHDGGLRAVNISSGERPTYRIEESDLNAWLESRRAVPATKSQHRGRRTRPKVEHKYV